MESSEAETYLNSLINKTLRVYATDSRMFVGTFKCTDAVSPPNLLFMAYRLDLRLTGYLEPECCTGSHP